MYIAENCLQLTLFSKQDWALLPQMEHLSIW